MGEPFLGEIRMFGFGFAPTGWAFCNGQSMPTNQNQALYSLLGSQFGGNGTTTFNLPDLRGRVPIHCQAGQAPGVQGGAETVPLTQAMLPSHTHQLVATSENGTLGGVAVPNVFFATTVPPTSGGQSQNLYASASNLIALNPNVLTQTGGTTPHDNMQPYQAVNFCIALTNAIYPPRP
jgi:microcystin-dependent protein